MWNEFVCNKNKDYFTNEWKGNEREKSDKTMIQILKILTNYF